MTRSDRTICVQSKHPTRQSGTGMALVFVLIILVVLSTAMYTLSSRIATHKHRQQFMIDYQNARYACDSGMKYALAAMGNLKFKLVERTDQPDFSDLFYMTEKDYQQYLSDWAVVLAERKAMEDDSSGFGQESLFNTDGFDVGNNTLSSLFSGLGMSKDPNSMFDMDGFGQFPGSASFGSMSDPNEIEIPGPYGVPWPFVTEPIEVQIGQARMRIEIADENAKMPLTWVLTSDDKVKRAANDATILFFEWMQMDSGEIDDLLTQLEQIAEIKKFTINPKPVTVTKQVDTKSVTSSTVSRSSRLRRSSQPLSRAGTTSIRQARPTIMNTADFARLLHSSHLNMERLARPVPDTGKRYESALKYLALWGSQRVNINTAPRHVLEAAFTFGGHHVEIADEIIRRRQEKPYKTIDELKESLYGYSTAIRECEPYITTESTFFSIYITAWSGSATASAVATVIKEGNQVQTIAMLTRR
ncbi:MAG: general secretion pathway protein GspK [Sedimentisphaerales bacterium]|nr:general secretion pathway protein GspK [Sedimentisphaerales bacterium]